MEISREIFASNPEQGFGKARFPRAVAIGAGHCTLLLGAISLWRCSALCPLPLLRAYAAGKTFSADFLRLKRFCLPERLTGLAKTRTPQSSSGRAVGCISCVHLRIVIFNCVMEL